MSQIIKDRLKEICPSISLKNSDDVKQDCHIAFEIIGYDPNDLDKSVEHCLEHSTGDVPLWQFIYRVWEYD